MDHTYIIKNYSSEILGIDAERFVFKFVKYLNLHMVEKSDKGDLEGPSIISPPFPNSNKIEKVFKSNVNK